MWRGRSERVHRCAGRARDHCASLPAQAADSLCGAGCVSVCAGVQTVRSFQELNYWGKTSDHIDAYNVGGPIYIDPNTTPLWAPSIPVTDTAC